MVSDQRLRRSPEAYRFSSEPQEASLTSTRSHSATSVFEVPDLASSLVQQFLAIQLWPDGLIMM